MPKTATIHARLEDPREQVADLSAGYEAVYNVLGVSTSIDPDNEENSDELTEADIEAYAAEARDDGDDRVYARDSASPATKWLAASADVAVELCTGDRRTCTVSSCPIAAAGRGQR